MNENMLLVISVGGTPQPICESIRQLRPQRVLFVVSNDTRKTVEEQVLPTLQQERLPYAAGNIECCEVDDAQSLNSCICRLSKMSEEVLRWKTRGDGYSVAVDFTGGTKLMSVALGLVAQRWPCRFVYVGGTQRSKNGVGTVLDGCEKVLEMVNPLDVLGYQAIEEARALCRNYAYAAANKLLSEKTKNMDDEARKAEIVAVQLLVGGLAAWDAFNHKEAKQLFDNLHRRINDLKEALGETTQKKVQVFLKKALSHLNHLIDRSGIPDIVYVIDLLANAKRRAEAGQYEDALARLYRAIEAMAQVRLRECHHIAQTGKVDVIQLPTALCAKCTPRAKDGYVSIGLQDSYELLANLNDPLGIAFIRLGLEKKNSPLHLRNVSILAHGFKRIGEMNYKKLWAASLDLLYQVVPEQKAMLPVFIDI